MKTMLCSIISPYTCRIIYLAVKIYDVMRWGRAVGVIIAAAFLSGTLFHALRLFPGTRESSPCPGCNVLIITIDALRADHLGLYGYGRDVSGNLDGLGASG